MSETSRILLIDDDPESSQNLETVLSFLGESTISAHSDNWQRVVSVAGELNDEATVALIGKCTHTPLEKLLDELYQWEAAVPYVLVGEHPISGSLNEDLLSRITAILPVNLSYQPLLDALHKAKVFHEHFNRLRNYEGVRDYSMFRSLVGESDAVQQVRYMMGQVANKEVSVLITGESGTGKEVIARNLHLNSSRAEKPFVPINCGAIPRELLESELFGHEKGAFTGAVAARIGRFELAEGGTLFLDEIGDMPLSMQVKMLRVLQERSFERVGGVTTIKSDVRILAATHKDLEVMIEQGDFRQDLYYRLNVFPIEMPPLRERGADIPLLLNELISIMETENRGSVRFNSAAITSLRKYSWPGNVRELANLIERMAILYPHGIVGLNELPENSRPLNKGPDEKLGLGNVEEEVDSTKTESTMLPPQSLDLKEYLARLEKDLIEKALKDCGGVVARAADRLNIPRTTLVEKVRKYSLQRKSSTADADSKPEATQESDSSEGDEADLDSAGSAKS